MSTQPTIRVLVAEDEFLVGKAISHTLDQIGYELIGTASDGAKAVEMTCQLRPDVVLMDIKMPKLNGIEASAQIQDRCPTPIVVLTAHESAELVTTAAGYGVAAYLTKPPDASAIQRAVTISIARHGDLMEVRRLCRELESHKSRLEEALADVRTLRGILPICAKCKQVRDDKGFWHQVEIYIEKHSDAQFSHGLCPPCMEDLYGDEGWYVPAEK